MWQGKWIRPAYDRGIAEGYSTTLFMPNRAITRAEATKVILATFGYSAAQTVQSYFSDVNGWSSGWVQTAYQNGFINGYGNGYFRPDQSITRAEAAKIISNIIGNRAIGYNSNYNNSGYNNSNYSSLNYNNPNYYNSSYSNPNYYNSNSNYNNGYNSNTGYSRISGCYYSNCY